VNFEIFHNFLAFDYVYLKMGMPVSKRNKTMDHLSLFLEWCNGWRGRLTDTCWFQKGRILKFDHTCLERMPEHTVCYPVVSACSTTITFPTVHLKDSEAFNSNLGIAIRYGSRFDRV